MKKMFTLVELIIITIVILIIASIVLINIQDIRMKAKESALLVTDREVQAAVDRYYLDNNVHPTLEQPTFVYNQTVLIEEKLFPKYLKKNLPKEIYCVDFNGTTFRANGENCIGVEFLNPIEQMGCAEAEAQGYICVYTIEELAGIRNLPNARYILMNDLDMKDISEWVPIGGSLGEDEFTGEFNGNGYTIKNFNPTFKLEKLNYNVNGDTYYMQYGFGLFGLIEDALIKDLWLDKASITIEFTQTHKTANHLGSLVGHADSSAIQNIVLNDFEYKYLLSDDITADQISSNSVGGLIGSTSESYVNGISAKSISLWGEDSIGGIVGIMEENTIEKVIAKNILLNTEEEAGGVVGVLEEANAKNVTVENVKIQNTRTSYFTDTAGGAFGVLDYGEVREISVKNIEITGAYGLGGVLGMADEGVLDSIKVMNYKSYSPNSLMSIEGSGGVAGAIDDSTVSNMTIEDIQIEGDDSVGGVFGVVDMTNINGVKVTNVKLTSSYGSMDAAGGFAGVMDEVNVSNVEVKDVSIVIEDNPNNSNSSDNIAGFAGVSSGVYRVGGKIDNIKVENVVIVNKNPKSSTEQVAGLIGSIDYQDVSNITLKNIKLQGNEGVGALAAYFDGRNYPFEGVYSIKNIVAEDIYIEEPAFKEEFESIGGLIGYVDEGEITNITAKKIKININSNNSEYIGGLFGIGEDLNMSNLTISDIEVNAEENELTGGLFGGLEDSYLIDSDIQNINVKGNIETGGVSGYIDGMILSNVTLSSIEVSGNENTGGLAGVLEDAELSNLSIDTKVVGIENTGGLAGILEDAVLSEVSINSNVNGHENTGGVAGYNDDSEVDGLTVITNTTGILNTGGYAGYSEDGIYKNIAVQGNVVGNENSGGIMGYHYGDIELEKVYSRVALNKNRNSENNLYKFVGGFIGNYEFYDENNTDYLRIKDSSFNGTPFKLPNDSTVRLIPRHSSSSVDDKERKSTKSKDVFKKTFIRHGYQEVGIRMFRLKDLIIINKAITICAANEQVAIDIYENIKKHFENHTTVEIEYVGDENSLQKQLEMIFAESGEYIRSFKQKRDHFGRFVSWHIDLQNSATKKELSVEYELAGRNAHHNGKEIKAKIHYYDKESSEYSHQEYSHNDYFSKTLQGFYEKFKTR